MPEFAWPYTLLSLPLPLLVRWLLPHATSPIAALRVPFFDRLDDAGPGTRSRGSTWLLGALCWSLLVVAAARPQFVGEPLQQPVSGRDLMLAVDISGSMRTEDMLLDGRRRSRLAAVQAIAGDFIARRRGDRIGLILFGTRPYLQVPLTFDHQTLRSLLDEAEIGLAGKETAIGDAIGLAVKRLRDTAADSRVLILITDGASNRGALDPRRAAQLAAQTGLRIYTIGVGAEEMVVEGLFGRNRINPSADLDEAALRAVAEQTGGRYFRARDTAELAQTHTLLDRLEPVARVDQRLRPVYELYPWPLGAALIGTVLLAVILIRPARLVAETPSNR